VVPGDGPVASPSVTPDKSTVPKVATVGSVDVAASPGSVSTSQQAAIGSAAAVAAASYASNSKGVSGVSHVIYDRQRPMMALAKSNATRRMIEIASFDGGAFSTTASIELPEPVYALRDTPIDPADVTGDGLIDFVAYLDAAQPIAVVVSDDGGAWHIVPVADASGIATESYLGGNPHLFNGALVSSVNGCSPSCAEGSVVDRIWVYKNGVLGLGL